MRCYYEVLSVSKDVGDEELRKSYRRLALQFHPDKNPDNPEEAKEKFQEIQNAYEILSDPQERAFYDRNRESILRGEEFGSGRKEDEIHLYKYFTASCYSGFNDSETGFYTVYRQVFEMIASKDMKFIDEDIVHIPNFGKSDTDLEDVAEFYGYWQSYCTSVSFFWVDKYDIRQAPNRWAEKRIERENKKVRDKAKKEFNEEVRSLVAFVRKRDKRWQARKKQLEEKVAANAQKQIELQRKHHEERTKWMQETFEEQKEALSQYEQQLKEMESKFAEEWGLSGEESEEDETANDDVELLAKGLYCIACEKVFKSEKAFANHEQSRKHQENRANLAAVMAEEEADFTGRNGLVEELQGGRELKDPGSEEDVEIQVPYPSKKKKKQKLKKEVYEETKTKTKHSRTNKRCSDGELASLLTKDAAKLDAQKNAIVDPPKSEVTPNGDLDRSELSCGDSPETNSSQPGPRLKGKKAKDARKKARVKAEDEVSHTCTVCNSKFESKNKLFAHLKSTDHAAPKFPAKSKRT